MAESGAFDMRFLFGPTPRDVSTQLSLHGGFPTMPQLFAVSYHQCRWNYNDQADVYGVDAGFDQHDIPYDVLWLDIEHTVEKKYFTWDERKFPDTTEMFSKLDLKGRKMVTIIDPHIKKDDTYHVSKQAHDLGIFVKDKNGNEFEGWCWPGNSQWIDYTDPAARAFWASLFTFDKYGATNLYTWNDMNEPSVFSGPEISMPRDNIHFGNVEHRVVHNMYGMLQVYIINIASIYF